MVTYFNQKLKRRPKNIDKIINYFKYVFIKWKKYAQKPIKKKLKI